VTRFDGHHLKGEEDGKRILKSYVYEFKELTTDQIRIAPNALDLIGSDLARSQHKVSTPAEVYDVCVSFSSASPVRDGNLRACKVVDLIKFLRLAKLKVFVHDGEAQGDHAMLAEVMQGVKVLVACISNVYATSSACSRLFQYAKKTLERTTGLVVLPCIFEPAGFANWAFQQTVVGLLIAGELYIDFSNSDNFGAKSEEIMLAMRDHVNLDGAQDASTIARPLSATADAETGVCVCTRVCVRARMCARARARACESLRVCACVCVRACVRAYM
jgi:hypothetical protein